MAQSFAAPWSVDSGQPDPGRKIARAPVTLSELIVDLGPMQRAVDLPDLWAGMARAIVRVIHADACLVSVVEEGGRVVRDAAAAVAPPARLNHIVEEYRLEDFPGTEQVLREGKALEVRVDDPDADETEVAVLKELGFSTVLICPLTIEGRNIGLVEVYRLEARSFRRDDPGQVATLCAFAENAYARLQLNARLEGHYTETLSALASALEAKDPYTQEHTGRIRELALALGAAMQVDPQVRRALGLGAILHDVGKIGIADSILLKPGPLTDQEWEVMKTHPQIGERMLSDIDFMRPALPIIRHHHERWDGGGYPDKLNADEIPLGARIVAVCDSFDAMTSDRPYRRAMSKADACNELLRFAGSQFDPACVALLVEVVERLGEEHPGEKFVRYAS